MKRMDDFLQRVGIRHPIIQAPMAGVSTVDLAAAVSNAGGLGSLGVGASPVEAVRAMLESMRARTRGAVNVNVFCHRRPERRADEEAAWVRHLAPLFEAYHAPPPQALEEIYRSFLDDRACLELLLEQKPAVVSFHFGLPPVAWIDALRGAGVFTMATATCLDEAVQIERAGVDAIVAQGFEAGGHRGVFDPATPDEALPCAVLVRQLVKRTRLPVIASGGIMDGAGIRAMLALGAVAAQLGTAFVACPESSAGDGYRAMLHSPRAASTRMTSAISGRPARGIVNRLIAFAEAPGAPRIPPYPLAYDAAKRLAAAAQRQGSAECSAMWAGQGAPLIREMPAAELVAALVEELGVKSEE